MTPKQNLVVGALMFASISFIANLYAGNRWLRDGEGLRCFAHYMGQKEHYVTRDLAPGKRITRLERGPQYHGYPVELIRYSQALPCVPEDYYTYIGYNLLRSAELARVLEQTPHVVTAKDAASAPLIVEYPPFPPSDRKKYFSFHVVGASPNNPSTVDWELPRWQSALHDFDRVTKSSLRPDWVTDAMIASDRLIGRGFLLGPVSEVELENKNPEYRGWIFRGDNPDEILFISHDGELQISREAAEHD